MTVLPDGPIVERLKTEPNIWLATTRSDGRPHLVPIWFVWQNDEIYILTTLITIKAKNLRANKYASVALENGSHPVIAECKTRQIDKPFPADLASAFSQKYQWDIRTDAEYDGMFALTPLKWLTWTA